MFDLATIRAAIRRSLIIAMQGIGFVILLNVIILAIFIDGRYLGRLMGSIGLIPTATTMVTITPHSDQSPASSGSATTAATVAQVEG